MKNTIESIHVKDKAFCHHSYYISSPVGLEIIRNEDYSLISINIYIENEMLVFKTAQELFNWAVNYTESYAKETLIIYTFDLIDTYVYLKNYIDEVFGKKCLYLLPIKNKQQTYKIEIRDLGGFTKNYLSAKKELHIDDTKAIVAYKYAKMLYDKYFIPEKYFYLSSYQRVMKHIKKAYKDQDEFNGEEAFPNWLVYRQLNNVKRGGICFNTYKSVRIQDDLLCLDRTSAYIHDLLLEKHAITAFKIGNEQTWDKYDTTQYAFYGLFKIVAKKTNKSYLINSLYDLDAEKIWLTDVDIEIIKQLYDIKGIECIKLRIAKKDYLPEYVRDVIVEKYTDKVEAIRNNLDEFTVKQCKLIVNSIFGNMIRKVETEEDFKNLTRAVLPAWGIWTAAYARRALVKMITSVETPFYGDTDSVYCFNTDNSISSLNKYNNMTNNRIKEYCDEFGYDYDILKGLGTFKIEHNIKDFIAHATKQYGYITDNNEEIIKCSGYELGTINYKMLLDKKLPSRTISLPITDKNDNVNTITLSAEQYDLITQANEINRLDIVKGLV